LTAARHAGGQRAALAPSRAGIVGGIRAGSAVKRRLAGAFDGFFDWPTASELGI
jgi:hypothetical protein